MAFDVAVQTAVDYDSAVGGCVPRTTYLRLQRSLREERATYTREVLALQQALSRVEAAMRAFHAEKRHSTLNPSSVAASQDAVARAVSHVEVLSRVVSVFDVAREIDQEKDATLLALRHELEAEALRERIAAGERERSLSDDVARLRRDLETARSIHSERVSRIEKRSALAARRYAEHIVFENTQLKAKVTDLETALNASRADLDAANAQANQYAQQLTRLQQKLAEGGQERAAMRAALKDAASSFEAFAVQQHEVARLQASRSHNDVMASSAPVKRDSLAVSIPSCESLRVRERHPFRPAPPGPSSSVKGRRTSEFPTVRPQLSATAAKGDASRNPLEVSWSSASPEPAALLGMSTSDDGSPSVRFATLSGAVLRGLVDVHTVPSVIEQKRTVQTNPLQDDVLLAAPAAL